MKEKTKNQKKENFYFRSLDFSSADLKLVNLTKQLKINYQQLYF